MKHGWPLKKVGELFDVQLGKMLSPRAKEGDQFPYLANFNVQWGKFDLGNVKSMHFTESEKEKYALKQGDILMCEGGEVGRCAIWNERSTNFYFQKALHRLRPKDKNTINPYFMCIYMEYITTNNGVTKIVGETSIAHLTREKLCALKIPCPPKNQQDKIDKTIGTWDAAIEKTERLIAAKEKQFKWLLKRLISDQQDNPKWRNVKLGDICRILKGQGLSKDSIREDGKNKCILYGQLYTVYPEIVSKVISRTNTNNGVLSEKGDVLIPGSTTTQGIDLANSTALFESGVLLGGDINIIQAVNDNLYDASFFAYYLTHLSLIHI